MYSMFFNARAFNGNISGWDVSGVTGMNAMFDSASAFNGNISGWDVSKVTDMRFMFDSASAFNGNISGWNVSKVTDMGYMFADAVAFNGNISGWDVSKVTDMNTMFFGSNFNQPLNDWNVSGVTNIGSMFAGAVAFNGTISGWDVSGVTDMNRMFLHANAFNGNISGWDVLGVTDMRHMFRDADSFNGDISGWDVSKVTNMNTMFADTVAFNGDISGWNVSKVTDMNTMFANATAFNGNISGWNVSKVTNMGSMFANATAFNGDISGWDVSGVTFMNDMLDDAALFQQNLGEWYVVPADTAYDATTNTLNVTTISAQNSALNDHSPNYAIGTGGNFTLFNMTGSTLMFKTTPSAGGYAVNVTAPGGDFGTNNHRILEITVTGSTNAPPTVMAGSDLTVAEGGTLALSGAATDTDGDAITSYRWSAQPGSGITFANASSASTTFTAPPVNADVTSTLTLTASDGTDDGTDTIEVTVKETSGAFIITWSTATAGESITILVGSAAGTYDVIWGDGTASTGVTGDRTHPYAVSGDHTVAITGGFERIYLNDQQPNAGRLASIDQWGDTRWTSMGSAFHGASAMTYSATDAPDLSGVTDMSFMFTGASSFNGDLSSWNVSGVTNMSEMFTSASSFNGNISGWDVSGVTDMSVMFEDADSFNRPLNGWNVSGVTDMSSMFFGTDVFNQNISGWNVSGVTDMSYMFYEAAFNGDISGWDVSGVTDMSSMFYDAYLFDQPLNDWKVSGVTDMSFMFFSADVFNQNISGWDVSEVTNMRSMFHDADSFNQPLNDWDVSKVNDMDSMFHDANSFQQNLGKWYVNLDSTEISSAPGIVGGISAQNQELREQYPKYGIGEGFDGSAFDIVVDDQEEASLNMTVSPDKHLYQVDVTSEGEFSPDSHRVYNVTVTGNLPPTLDAIGNATVNEGMQLELDAVASDPSHDSDAVENDTLMFSLAPGHQTSAGISVGGRFTWTPTELDDGTHAFTVQVSDGRGGSDAEEFTVTVNEDPQNPVLSSILDMDGDEGVPLTFNATATDTDVINGTPDSLTYSLEGDAVPGASLDAASGEFTWTPTESDDGTYSVTVRATDGSGASATEDLVITIREVNEPPTAEAGTYGPHGEGVTVTLDGTGSTDPDTISGVADARSYSWVQMVTGHTVTLSSATAVSPTFTSPTVVEDVTLTFELTVTDGSGATDKDTATVLITDNINEIPDAQAGLDDTFDEGGTTVTLDGRGSSDPNDDSLTYAWAQTAGTPSVTLSGAATSRASFTTPVVASNQDLTFTLTVTDSRGGSDTDDVVITVRDSASNAPIANIASGSRGADENVTVTLDGSGSSDPNGDSLTFTWAQTGGTPTVTLSSNNDTASFTTPVVKENTPLTFTLVVSDGSETNNASVIITVVNNEPDDPVAVATGPAEADEGAIVTLDGRGSSDPNGDTLTFTWVPPQGVTLSDEATESPTFTAPQVFRDTDHTFTLTVRDIDGNEDEDSVTVRVRNSQNEPPAAEASSGTGGEADEGEPVTLDGSGSSDPNGDALTYSWEYRTGTPPLDLQGNDTQSPTFTAPQVKAPAALEFILTVTDSHGDSDGAEVTITVLDSHSNLPVSNPGGDQTIGEGAVVTLDGNDSSDPNGDAISYAWEQVGASGVSLSDPNSAVTTFTAPQVSQNVVLEFALRVTDVDGSHTETVSVTVQNSQTNTPIARPQVSGEVHEGGTVTLDGTNSYDPNGDSITHLWTQISGLPVTLSGQNTDTATFQAPRIPDPITLVFELAVTDDVTTGTARLSVVIPNDRNDPPVLEPIPAQEKDELRAVSFQASAMDIDGNDLRFALAGEIPRGASITRNGAFSWTPDQSQDGPYSLNVTVSDGDGGTDSKLAQITVRDIAPRQVLARASGSSVILTLSEIVTSGSSGPTASPSNPAAPSQSTP